MAKRGPGQVAPMGRVAVVAHRKKSLGGGLAELRRRIAEEGVDDPLWYEVSKSKKAAKRARAALAAGAELVFVWGGDGTVQRCLDALAGSPTAVAIVPAGTVNLLAANLGIPADLAEAVRVGLRGRRAKLDLGMVNGEHFAVMAGIGFDAMKIRLDGTKWFRGRATCVLLGNFGTVTGGIRAFPNALESPQPSGQGTL